ncbi:hypothetical protein Tco_0534087 [Tanacetum coccineum]
MAALIISISSDLSDESVGSLMPVLELESHSPSEISPFESSLPPVPVALMVLPFLCSDDSESEPLVVLPERHVSSSTYIAMVGRWRSKAIPFGRPYRTHPNGPCQVLTVRKSVGLLPSHRLALRYTSHHSSSNNFTSDSLPDSPLDSSSDSSSDHSLSDHSLMDHSPKDYIEEDIDAGVPADVGAEIDVRVSTETDEGIGLDVEPFREDFPDLVSADGIASIETRHRLLEADSVIASTERVGLSSCVAVLERSNTRLRETLRMKSVRADMLRRRLSFVKDELRLIHRSRYYKRMRRIVELVGSSSTSAIRAAGLEAESQSQNGDEGNDNNGNGNIGRNGNIRNGNPNGGAGRDAPVARVYTYKYFLNCQPRNFSGTEGVIGLARWFEKMESVFHISNCPLDSQVKFATCTLLDGAMMIHILF